MTKTTTTAIAALLLVANLAGAQVDEPAVERRIAEVEQKLESQDDKMKTLKDQAGAGCFILFLFGFVLSMWAMNRGRDGCGWFILGFIPGVNIVAALFALSAENERRKARLRHGVLDTQPSDSRDDAPRRP